MEEEDIRQGQRGHELRSPSSDTSQQPGCEHAAVRLGTCGPDVANGEKGKADDIDRSTAVFDGHGSPNELSDADGQSRSGEEVGHLADVVDEVGIARRSEEGGRHGHGTHGRTRAAGVAHGYAQAREGEDVVLFSQRPVREKDVS